MLIVYKNGDGVALISPVPELDILEVAEKDVPVGVAFWIVDKSFLPSDRTYRDAWELDTNSLGNPDGYGGAA